MDKASFQQDSFQQGEEPVKEEWKVASPAYDYAYKRLFLQPENKNILVQIFEFHYLSEFFFIPIHFPKNMLG